jgi:hypothetical protein
MRTWAKSLAKMEERLQYGGLLGQLSSIPATPEQSSVCEEHEAWCSKVSSYASYSSQARANQNVSGPPVEHKANAVVLHREHPGELSVQHGQPGSYGPS